MRGEGGRSSDGLGGENDDAVRSAPSSRGARPFPCSDENDADYELASSRVRVIPGSCPSLYPEAPSPPDSPPPRPGHLCKIAMVGDARSGKTSLVQKIVHRIYSHRHEGDGANGTDGRVDGAASRGPSAASADSAGSPETAATSGVTSYDGPEPRLAKYHKKDVTIWDSRIDSDWSRENARRERGGEEALQERPVCVRVQLWDMNVHRSFVDRGDEPDSNSVRSGDSSFHSPRPVPDIAPLLSLLRRIHGVMIACRCPPPPSSSSPHSPDPSPNVSLASSLSNNSSGGEWPELHSVEQQIQRWTYFLSEQLNSAKQKPIIFVTLSCADLVVARYSPREWVRLDDEMQIICGKYGIDSWSMSTCTNSGSGGDDEDSPQDRQTQKQPTLLRRMQERQRRLLEDMEDAAETALIDMVSMLLA